MKARVFWIFFLSAFLVLPSYGSLENLVSEFQKTKDKFDKNELQQRKLLGSLFNINRNIKKVVSEKSRLDEEKNLVEESVRELASKTIELEQKTKTQKSHLRSRLSAIYQLGGAGIARVLLSSSSSAELERNLKIMGIVAKIDLALIKDYTKTKKDLAAKRLKLTRRWEKLKNIEAKIAKKEESFLAQNKEKMQILEQVKKTQTKALSRIAQIRKKSRLLSSVDETGVLDLLFQASFAERKGFLPHPVQGQLIQKFGVIRDQNNQLVFPYRGHLYSTDALAPVKAVFSGTVAYVGAVAGYGNTVILDHGDHYYSVYAHLQNLTVNMGDQVSEQEKIASSGEINSNNSNGIYFEIRHFSEPSDPKLWVKGT